MRAGEGASLGGGLREDVEERGEDAGVELLPRGELPQDRSELVAEGQYAGGEEVRESLLDVAQPKHVRDVARPFDGEHETGVHGRAPAAVALGSLERIEGAVELDGRKVLPDELQLSAMCETPRIEVAAPARVSPPRGADAHAASCRSGTHAPRLGRVRRDAVGLDGSWRRE